MRQLLRSIPFLVMILTLVCYAAALVPPGIFWPAGILIYGILPLLVVNIVLFLWLAILKRKTVVWPVLSLLIGIPFINITFSYGPDRKINRNEKIIEVLSLNAKNFSMDPLLVDWLLNDTSGIKCIQEYYSNSRKPGLNIQQRMEEKGYEAYLLNTAFSNGYEFSGLATFTRYPVVNRGALLFNETTGNNCIYTDLKIGTDTIRIYNVHLYSMRIPLGTYRHPENYDRKLKSLIRKLKNGAIRRSEEIDRLLDHSAACPYPFIICGDFNDIPYSYNYFKLRRHLQNAFEEAGQGFGFSFRHWLIFFLRIDHQFLSDKLDPLFYRVDHHARGSDHYPTRGIYRLP